MGSKRGLRTFVIGVLSLTLDACTEVRTPPPDEHAEASLSGAPRILAVDEDLVPILVRGAFGAVPSSVAAVRGVQAEELAPVVSRVAPLFRVAPEQLFLKKAYVGFDGDAHFRFGVRVNDVEVMGSELRLHARNGQVFEANGDARGDLPAPVKATVTADAASSTALADRGSPPHSTVSQAPKLVYWREGGQLLLAYRLRLTGEHADGTQVDDTVLVNARSGDLFKRYSNIHTAGSIIIYDGRNTTTLPGWPVNPSDPAVHAAIDNLRAVYRCYNALFGRDSYDNSGAAIIGTVHHRANYVNAFWDGSQLVFGDGDGVNASNLAHSLDVSAHELTHAVTDFESGLIYSGESGSLSEAISDIFAAVCDWHHRGLVDASTWMLADDVWTPGIPGDGLRYLHNPKLDGESLDSYLDYNTGVDVHLGSGIANLAFYLLAQGGVHPRLPGSPAVQGIGIEKAARIFYKMNTDMLIATSDFRVAKLTSELAAGDLGYDAQTVAAVSAAWKAVHVGEPPTPVETFTLQKDVPVSLSGTKGSIQLGHGLVPPGATRLRFALAGGSGDADLYVRQGLPPTTGLYDCRPFMSGSNETCGFSTPQTGTWFVMVHAYSHFNGASLVMTWE